MTTIDTTAEPDLSIATTGNSADVAEATPEPSSPFFHSAYQACNDVVARD